MAANSAEHRVFVRYALVDTPFFLADRIAIHHEGIFRQPINPSGFVVLVNERFFAIVGDVLVFARHDLPFIEHCYEKVLRRCEN